MRLLRNKKRMICPKCLGATKVTDSRVPSKDECGLIRRGQKVFGWWCSDYRVRKRLCKVCELVFHTVEVSIKDLNEAFEDAKHE